MDPVEHSSFESYIKKMAGQGRRDSEGVFTLDISAEAAKLRQLYASLEDYWFLCLLQAAVCALAEKVELKISRDRLLMAWRTDRRLPVLNSSEQHEYLQYLKRAASILEAQAFPAFTFLQWECYGEGQCLFRDSDSQELLELPGGVGDQIARQCGWAPNGPFQVVVEVKQPRASWLGSLKNRIGLQWRLEKLLKTRSCHSPVQVHLGWGISGQGDSTSGHGELAAEYLVGPADGDVFVKEREPGRSTVYLQFNERWSGPFDGHRRAMARWDVAPANSPFPSFICHIPSPKPESGRISPYYWGIEGRSRRGLIPFTRREVDDQNQTVWLVDSTLQLPEHLHLKGEISPLGVHGLPCYAVLILPRKPKGLGTVHFLRRGVLIESREEDLGIDGAVVYVSCSRLETDATGFAVVRNEEYENLLEFLRGRLLQLASDMILLGREKKIDVRALVRAVERGLAAG